MKLRFCFLLFSLLVIISSCTSYKKVPYFQTEELKGQKDIELFTLYKENIIRFQPDDILSITINVPGEQSIAVDFNLPVQPTATTENSAIGEMSSGYGRQTYQINKEGDINFPFLGYIKAAGYTKEELERSLKKSLRQYIKVDPIVTVHLTNFRISILGEVNRPGQYTLSRDRFNVMEALSLAGDMTIYGKRENVRLMRELPNGEIKIVQLDVSSAGIVSSPYFYLQQNDLLYVQPNSAKTKSSDIGSQTSIMLSIGSMLLTVVSIVIMIVK